MAKIALRVYLQEIDRMVSSNRIDEAIAHSRHILQNYPRCIAVYRLLGRAYSEGKRFSDAADIFQRVLSSLPDDEVSHIGMSIIREDEGNTNEAHWHMQMAYEVDPSNSVIQDELRRLIGKREGIEPPRIRLTRGALARMYIKGDLIQEAITELRAALGEEPNRLDLKGLLANALARMGQRVEAVEIANQILRKLPNHLDANRILAELLAGTERDVEAQSYRQTVCSLDPYYYFVTLSTPVVEQVPDQTVSLERLEWKTGQPQPGSTPQPVWASSLGIEISEETGDEEALPDWLASEADTPKDEDQPGISLGEAPAPVIFQQQMGEPEVREIFPDINTQDSKGDEELPDWMIEAGWVPTSNLESEPTLETEKETAPQVEAEEGMLDQTEIPDWLKGIAIAETSAEIFGKSEAAETPDSETKEELPEWVFEQEPGYSSETRLPPWLAESAIDAIETIEADELEKAPEEGLPDWLFVEEEKHEVEVKPETTLPDWLMTEAGEAELLPTEEILDVEKPADEIPSWLFEEQASQNEAFPVDEEIDKRIQDQLKPFTTVVESQTEAAIIEGEEVSDKPEPLMEHAKAAITLPAWLLANQEGTEPAVEDLEVGTGVIPIENLESGSEPGDTATEEKASSIPAWLFEDDLGEVPIDIEDTKPSKIIKPEEIAAEGEIFQHTPVPETTFPSQDEAQSDEGSPSIPAQEFAQEMPIEEEEDKLGWLASLGVKEALDENLEPLPEWLLEEDLQDRIESISSLTEPAGEVIFSHDVEIISQKESDKTEEITIFSASQADSNPTSVEMEEEAVKEPEFELPDWLFVAASVAPEDVEESPATIQKTVFVEESVQERTIFEVETDELAKAQGEVLNNNLEKALVIFNQMIESNQKIPEVIQDLKAIVENSPDNVDAWQALGYAYLCADQTQEALNAYRQAEKLLSN